MGLNGGSYKNEQISNTRIFTDVLLPNDPSYKENVEVLGKGFMNLRMNNYKILENTSPQMDIQASLSEDITFNLGDVFFFDDAYWLCIESHETSTHKKGKIEECNYELKWQNPKTSKIISRWCSVRDPYTGELDENNTIKTGNSKCKIKLSHDEETALFHVDKRFLIGIANTEPIPYSIINYDSVTNSYSARNEGFLVINLRQSIFNPKKDNKYLMIADYNEPKSIEQPSTLSCKITYNGKPIIREGGSPKIFTAFFYDIDGEIITTLTPTWELILPSELENLNKITILSDVGNRITIGVKSGDISNDKNVLQSTQLKVIGMTFILKASADDPNFGFFTCEQEIEIIELF